MKSKAANENKKGFSLEIKGKLILIFFILALSITGILSVVSYISGSSSIHDEATAKLAAIAELKTKNLDTFMANRFGEVHVMTGINVIKQSADGLVAELKKSDMKPSLSLDARREYLKKNSLNFKMLHQYIDKYFKALGTYAEIKFVAAYDIRNRRGEVIFAEGDQVLSVGEFKGNTKNRSMYTGAMEMMKNRKTGAEAEKYSCPLLYTSSIEWCGELEKPSIHMAHGLGRYGISMNDLKKESPVSDRYSLMMIFDININEIDKLLQDRTGMGESGETFLADRDNEKIIMVTESRFEKGAALKKDLSKIKGIADHFKRDEHRRGAQYCQNVMYTNYMGEQVLSHNHLIDIGEHQVAVITEIDEHEVFASVSNLLILMIGLGISVLIGAAIMAVLFSRTISLPLKESVVVAESIAGGDLTVEVNSKYKKRNDEIGALARALDRMSGDLNQLISSIIISSKNLSQAVGEISSGNQNLSQRVSEQASSLEEIASTVEEANATTKQNADNSQEANSLTVNTFALAEDGGRVSEEAVNGINEISDVSKKIGDITNVINEISFQTNLLALNAAVEAARAGEAGRGFAVVAGEIRNLAQRSGNAAKEIETLIKETIHKIENGSGLVNKSGESLRGIIDSIKQVRNIVEEISQSSVEQKQGMDQIAVAVTEMDSMTQQNAALVEETASASEEMANQAQELLGLTRRFKVDGDDGDESHRKSIEIKSIHSSAIKNKPEVKPKEKHSEAVHKKMDEAGDIGKAMREEGFEEF